LAQKLVEARKEPIFWLSSTLLVKYVNQLCVTFKEKRSTVVLLVLNEIRQGNKTD